MSPARLRLLGLALSLAVSAPAAGAPFTAGNIVVARIGSGSGLSSSNGNAVSLREYTPDGAPGITLDLPSAGGPNLVVGSETRQAGLTRSVDGRYLLLGGFNVAAGQPTAGTNRIIGRVDRDGNVDLTTSFSSTHLGAEAIRSVASPSGTAFWFGCGDDKVRYAVLGATTPTHIANVIIARQVSVHNGQLYASGTAGTSTRVVGTIGSGLPTSGPETFTVLPGLTSGAPVSIGGFFLADRSSSVSGPDTLYVADEGGSLLRKYSFDGTTWTARGTLAGITNPISITAVVEETSVTLYVVAGTSTNNSLYKLTDSAAYNANISASVGSPLATAGAGYAFRGVAPAPVAASAVGLERFEAIAGESGTQLFWRTGWEAQNLGFYIYRLENGERTRLNPQLIPGSALNGGAQSAAGYGYRWDDSAPGGAYLLEDVDLRGRSTWHGPFEPRAGPPRREQPVRSTSAGPGGAVFEGPIRRTYLPGAPQVRPAELAGRRALKIHVREEGWYRVTGAELFAAGLPRRADPRTLRLFTEGREVALEVPRSLESGGEVRFYGLGLDSAESDQRTYWLTWGGGRGRRIRTALSGAPTPGAAFYPETVERRENTLYYAGALNGPESNFFGGVVTATPLVQELAAPHLAPGPGVLEVRLHGFTDLGGKPDHRVRVHLNGEDLGDVTWDGKQAVTGRFPVPPGVLTEAGNRIELRSEGPAPDVSLLQSVRLTYPRRYQARDGRLRCLVEGGTRVRLHGFEGVPEVLDVTDPEAPVRLEAVERPDGLWVAVPGRRGASRLLWAAEASIAPLRLERDAPSNLTSRSTSAGLLAISRPELREELEPLLDARAGLQPLWVDVQDIYDEYHWGHPSAEALRRFLQATSRRRGAPAAVLLAGDATYDPRGYLAPAPALRVPTGEVAAGGIETASDDWLADFNEDGIPELSVGRLPARSPGECAAMVARILAPHREPGVGLFVADTEDGFPFLSAARRAAAAFGGVSRVLSRAQPGDGSARSAFLSGLAAGPALVSYSGHGNLDFWRGGLLDSASARDLPPAPAGSVWLSMTCLTGYFTSPTVECLAEALLRSPSGAARAVWAGSTYCSAETQAQAQETFLRELSSGATLGEAARRAKQSVHDLDLRRTFILFGDPTATLR